jgi:CO dehydrogenase maturation factor
MIHTPSNDQTARLLHTSILADKRIGIFGKGGSGKSTAVVLLARYLQHLGYRVCVLDADSTNTGISLALGIADAPASLIEHFGGMIFQGGRVTCPVDDPARLPDSEIHLDELSPKFYRQNQDGIILLVAGKIGDQGPGAGCDGPVSKIARDIRINNKTRSLVTLVDFKAGFEDTARGVITGIDWAIMIIDPTISSIEMAENMRDAVDQIKNGELPATQHLKSRKQVKTANDIYYQANIKGVLFVLNKIDDSTIERYLERKLNGKGIHLNGVIHRYPSIPISWLKGTKLDVPEAKDDLFKIVEELESAKRISRERRS